MASDAGEMTPLFERLLVGALLSLTLVATFLVGLLTTYLLAVLALVTIGYLVVRGRETRWHLEPMAQLFLGAFALLVVLFAATAMSPADLRLVFNFTFFLLYAPFAILLSRHAAAANAARIASLALIGTALAALIAIVEGHAGDRALGINSDPIRFADTALIFGFLALMGVRAVTGRRRWLFLAGPLLALVVVVLSGARVAIVAYPVVAAAALLMLAPRRWVVPLAVALVALLVATGLLVEFSGNARFASLVTTIDQIAGGQTVTDESVHIRLELYRAGWAAFLQSPLIGHGLAHMMETATSLLPIEERGITKGLPHLHNELLNFAVFGGLVGVVMYFVLLLAPVWLALRSVADSQRPQRILATGIISVAYFMLGLTDTMISFELHTAFYVVLTAIILSFCRDEAAAADPPTR